jgi:hypothetical protein
MRSLSKSDTGAGKVLSRRSVLTGLAATCVAASAKWSWAAEPGGGPSFFADGPDAELYGAGENYPIKDRWRIYQPGNPASPKYRVGAFSHYDEIFPTRHVDRAATAWPFKRTPADVSYQYKGSRASLADYLARNPVTGLLIAKDDRILVERYQYDLLELVLAAPQELFEIWRSTGRAGSPWASVATILVVPRHQARLVYVRSVGADGLIQSRVAILERSVGFDNVLSRTGKNWHARRCSRARVRYAVLRR